MSERFGPWIGVPKDLQTLCAVEGCNTPGKPHVCVYDGSRHHHGCIHYDSSVAARSGHGLTFRQGGWGLVCDEHYAILDAAYGRRQNV